MERDIGEGIGPGVDGDIDLVMARVVNEGQERRHGARYRST